MSDRAAKELLASLIDGIEAHGVTVTPELRETLDERLASGWANALRAADRRRTNDEAKPEYTAGYLDLWRGVFSSAEGAAVIEHVARWPERERVIANGLCLAGTLGASSLHICDIALLWPAWFNVAAEPSDLTRLWYPARSRIRATLNRFGYDVQRVGEQTWELAPIDEANTGVTLSAKTAADKIRNARAALLSKDYETAGRHAIEAIDRCPVAMAAYWIVAEICRSNLSTIDRARQLQSAEALLDRKRTVHLAIDRLKVMQSSGRRTMRRDWVPDSVSRLTEELMVTAPLGDWAQQTVDAAIDGREGK
jgi:hypothetical protein